MEERYQIGSITSGYRVIRPGDEYDKYFPMYSPRNSKTMKRIIFDFWGNEDKSIQ